MAKDPTLKKKRKSEAVAMEVDAPAEGTASAVAVEADVEDAHAKKKAKKEKKEKKSKGDETVDAGNVTTVTEADVTVAGDEKKKAKKDKKEKDEEETADLNPPTLTPIASPLAPKKLHKKILKTTKKSSKARQLRRGVKEVVKALRKGEQGLLVLAGNITPVDVLSHMPLLAEECKGVEYVWVTSKEELGAAAGTKRATSVVLLCSTPRKRPTPKAGEAPKPAPTQEEIDEWLSPLNECIKEVKELPAQNIVI
ncbi:hypothetical protein FFLO_00265 [Filobasidium floriforme]|uniref:H/ACA ribonucleoprotein complex subunit 2 n=1 Tax=Filobasidium floriforme TaxID=5210 RepID=A0A8K0JRR4_9TREE|nr:putative nucleolar protein family A member 2 [Filobasidium floriforme]KAG7575446.1 hypothetical protein FFLO_00265 [Filobasidium floriforme]KAH8082583.1 putative nucleolar protein family A member 2 [Filobasidium floriforme]